MDGEYGILNGIRKTGGNTGGPMVRYMEKRMRAVDFVVYQQKIYIEKINNNINNVISGTDRHIPN